MLLGPQPLYQFLDYLLRFVLLLEIGNNLVHYIRHNISVSILRGPPWFFGLLDIGDEVLLFSGPSFSFWFLLCRLQFKKIGFHCDKRLGTFWPEN